MLIPHLVHEYSFFENLTLFKRIIEKYCMVTTLELHLRHNTGCYSPSKSTSHYQLRGNEYSKIIEIFAFIKLVYGGYDVSC